MTFFNLIKNQIAKIRGFFQRDKETTAISSISYTESEILKISDELNSIRNSIIPTITEPRIITLDSSQKSIIEKEVRLINVSHLAVHYDILRDLRFRIELLTTNKCLQLKKTYLIQPIPETILNALSNKIQPYDNLSIKKSELDRNRIKNLSDRSADLIYIKTLREEILTHSLIKLHLTREEEKREIERINQERILDEKFNLHFNQAITLLDRLDFDSALQELEAALQVRPERSDEIETQKKKIVYKKRKYEFRKTEFQTLIKAAESETQVNNFEKAIQSYIDAKQLNFDNSFCEKRIAGLQNKIKRNKELEEERKRQEQAEKARKAKFKDDAEEIIHFFKENGIFEFYHYTDSRNINSILQNNGLFSLNELNRRNIDFYRGSETSEKAEYVRLTYSMNHPLMHVSLDKGRIISVRLLNINLEVATFKDTIFSNVNVARTSTPPTVILGGDIAFLKNHLRLDIIKRPNHFNLSAYDAAFYQAEILVKEHLPIEYITNLSN